MKEIKYDNRKINETKTWFFEKIKDKLTNVELDSLRRKKRDSPNT